MRKTTWPEWVIGSLVLLAIVLIFIVISSYIIIRFPPVQTRLVAAVNRTLAEISDSTISVGRVSTNLLTYLELGDLLYRSPAQDTLWVKRVRCKYSISHLPMKQIVFTHVMLDGVKTVFKIDSTGQISLPRKFQPQTTSQANKNTVALPEGWTLTVSRIIVKKLNGRFDDLFMHQHAHVHEGFCTAYFNEKQGFVFNLTLKEVEYLSPWWKGSVAKATAQGAIGAHGMEIKKCEVVARETKLHGFGLIPFTETGYWDLSVTTSSTCNAIPILFTVLPNLKNTGKLAAKASWKGTFKHPEFALDLSGTSMEAFDIPIDLLKVKAGYDGDAFLTGNVQATTQFGSCSLQVQCEIPLLLSTPALKSYRVRGNCNQIQVAKLPQPTFTMPEFLNNPLITLNFTVGATDTFLPQEIVIHSAITTKVLSNDTLYLDAHLKKNTYQITLKSGENQIVSSGNLKQFKEIDGTAVAEIREPWLLTRYFFRDKVTGSLTAHAAIRGVITKPAVHLSLLSGNLATSYLSIDSLYSELDLTDTASHLTALRCQFSGDGKAQKNLPEKMSLSTYRGIISGSGKLTSPELSLEFFTDAVSYESISYNNVSGALSCNRLDSITVTNISGSLYDSPVQISLSGTGSIKKQSGSLSILLTDSLLPAGTGFVSGSFLDDSIHLKAALENLSLALLRVIPSAPQVNGKIDFAGTIDGNLANPILSSKLHAKKLSVGKMDVEVVNVSMKMVDSAMRVDASILQPAIKDSLTVSALLPLLPSKNWMVDTTGTSPFSLKIKAEDISLAPVAAAIRNDMEVDGNLSLLIDAEAANGKIDLKGYLNVLGAVVRVPAKKVTVEHTTFNGQIAGTLSDPSIRFSASGGPVKLSGGEVSQVRVAGNVTRRELDEVSVQIALKDSGRVLLDGTWPYGKNDREHIFDNLLVNYSVTKFPLTLLASLFPENVLQAGIVQGKGSIALKDGKPDISGMFELEKGVMTIDNIVPSIGPVSARLRLAGDTIFVTKSKAVWGKGYIKVTGKMVIRDNTSPDISFKIKAENLAATVPDVLYCAVDYADLNCTSVEDNVLVTGALLLGPTRYFQDMAIGNLIKTLQNESNPVVPNPSQKLLEKLRFNVGVDLQENASVDMNLGSLKLDGECILTGSAAVPTFTGEVNLVEGYILYLDRQFEIEHATLTNYEANALHPVIDLEAQSDIISITGDQIDNYTILLSLKGDLQNPVFQLRDKTGTLNQLEIVSILTLGQPLGGMSGDIKDRLRAFVSQSLLGFGSRKLEQFLGIEKIDFKGDILGGNKSSENSRLTIAKRVTPRLMVLYESDIGSSSRQKVSALYRLANNIYLSGESSSEGASAIDLIFKYSK